MDRPQHPTHSQIEGEQQMKWLYSIAAFGLVCTMGCRTKGPAFDPRYSTAPPSFAAVTLSNRLDPAWLRPATNAYRLGPGDVIEIEIMGDAQARAAATVGPDGKIYYSLLPGLSAWGLTLSETSDVLKSEMAKFIRATPEPAVVLRSVASKRFSVMGAVPNPGVYTLAAPMTLLEAISLAGGVPTASGTTDDAIDFSKSFILRDGQFLPVDLERLLKRGDLTQNVYVEAGDLVFLRPVSVPTIYVFGAVNSPNILPFNRNRTLATTIITAGGLQKYAQRTHVAIVRGGLTQPHIADVNYHAIVTGEAPDVPLEPGDIVYVPLSPFRFVYQLAEEVVNQFVRTIAVNEGRNLVDPAKRPVDISSPFGIDTGQ
jgi:polysaccharide export outer membrane protein